MHSSETPGILSLRRPAGAVFWLIVITGLLRLLIAGISGLGFGESYYAMGAVNPQLSYYDQPPLAFWLAWLSMNACGGYEALYLRLPSVLLFAGSSWLMYLLTRNFYGARAGFWAVLALNLAAVFTFTGAVWLQPDAPLMFFWLATALCLQSIFFREFPDDLARAKWRWSGECIGLWLLAGVLLGLTTLSKYHAGFLFAGAGIFALTQRDNRHWVWHPGPYAALLLCGIISLPIIFWNADNGWVSFAFQAGRAGAGGEFELHFDWLLLSVVGQALWLLPWIWLPLLWALWRCLKNRASDRAGWFCACTAVLPIAFFTVITLWSKLGFHFHWQAPGYMMLFPPLGALVVGLLDNQRRRRWVMGFVGLSAACTIFFGVVLQIHARTGFWTTCGPRWFWGLLGGEEDPTIEGYDYDELRGRFAREGWLDNGRVFVVSDRWHLSGKVDWALRGRKPVIIFHEDPRNIAFFHDQSEQLGKDAVYVSRQGEDYVRRVAGECFESIEKLPPQEITRGGITEITLDLYYCRNFRKIFPAPYGRSLRPEETQSGK